MREIQLSGRVTWESMGLIAGLRKLASTASRAQAQAAGAGQARVLLTSARDKLADTVDHVAGKREDPHLQGKST